MASDQKVVAALGRPFTLGMLYDAHKDELVPGFTLWDKKTLEEHRSQHSQQSSACEITSSDSIESKSKLLNVEASLKASFLSGLIEVEGSAKYLNDQKKFKNQSRVTLQYKATTSFEQLLMTEEEAKKMNDIVSEKESATHVVTGILYGANAFFVFDSEKLDASSVQEVQGSMQALIKKIPTVEISGKVEINLTEEEKAVADTFSCKFIGDFILPSNPTTFEEAVQTYVELPKLLKNNPDTVVPLKVWLTPLKKFSSTASELQGSICISLVSKVETALEDVGQAEMRCNESLDDEVVENVPEILKKLRNFTNNCQDYKSQLQQTMEKEFPLIRKGQKENASVEKLFDERENSPFSYDNLDNWLDNREREINVIRSCVEKMKAGTNVKMVAEQSDLDREILAPGVEHALCFVFTSVERDDSYLNQMTKYLHSHDPYSVKTVPQSAQHPWYNSNEVFRKMRGKAATFHELATGLKNNSRFRFLVTTMTNDKHQGATIYQYKDGVLVTEDFSQPSIPDVKKVTDQKDLIWYARDLTMDPNTVNNWLTLSDGNKKVTCGAWQKYPDHPDRFTEPQVLCTEGLTGRHYWEVEWSKGYNNNVGVGITYNRIERKGGNSATRLGSNDVSWYFGEKNGCLEAWHNGCVWSDAPFGCSRVGVYLDWPAGTLSFYDATSTTLKHIYTFTTTFTEPVYPGFWVYAEPNYVYLCPL